MPSGAPTLTLGSNPEKAISKLSVLEKYAAEARRFGVAEVAATSIALLEDGLATVKSKRSEEQAAAAAKDYARAAELAKELDAVEALLAGHLTDIDKKIQNPDIQEIMRESEKRPCDAARTQRTAAPSSHVRDELSEPLLNNEVMDRERPPACPTCQTTEAQRAMQRGLQRSSSNRAQRSGFDVSQAQRNYRADFQLKIGANCVAACCYLNCECDPAHGELPVFDPSDWGGRLSRSEYNEIARVLKEKYFGMFLSDICYCTIFGFYTCWLCAVAELCCCRDSEVTDYLDRINQKFRQEGRGIRLGYGVRLTVNGFPSAHKLIVQIVPI